MTSPHPPIAFPEKYVTLPRWAARHASHSTTNLERHTSPGNGDAVMTWREGGKQRTEMPLQTMSERMSSPQALTQNTGDTNVHVVSVHRARLCLPKDDLDPQFALLQVRSAGGRKGQRTHSTRKVLYVFGQLVYFSGKKVLASLQVIVKIMAQEYATSAPHLDFLVVWPRSMGCKPALLDQNTIPTETTKMTYKMPEKQKILPIPNKTLKMIGTAKPPEQEACRQQKVQCSPYPCI